MYELYVLRVCVHVCSAVCLVLENETNCIRMWNERSTQSLWFSLFFWVSFEMTNDWFLYSHFAVRTINNQCAMHMYVNQQEIKRSERERESESEGKVHRWTHFYTHSLRTLNICNLCWKWSLAEKFKNGNTKRHATMQELKWAFISLHVLLIVWEYRNSINYVWISRSADQKEKRVSIWSKRQEHFKFSFFFFHFVVVVVVVATTKTKRNERKNRIKQASNKKKICNQEIKYKYT